MNNKYAIAAVVFGAILIMGIISLQTQKTDTQNVIVTPVVQDDTQNATSTATSTPTKPTPTPTGPKTYTLAEISLHASASSCWTTIEGKVYDLTSFISQHPGGEANIMKVCGKDGTALFEGQHGGDNRPEQVLATLFIGNLK
jgi:cytochrome b involved in lipid metabolism